MRFAILLIWAVLLGSATGAWGQAWPSKPIRFLVPQAPGSTLDIVSRLVGNELSKTLGQPVIVDNKPGAGGTIAMTELARSAPDGYMISFTAQGILVFNQALYDKPGYDSIKDFAPLAYVGGVSNVMIVNPSSSASQVSDVIAAAKAKPGVLTYSSGGSGTSHHISGVLFAKLTGTELVHVPYKATAQGILAVMTGEVDMGFFNTPTVISQISGGKLKALGVTSLSRSPLLPDVPTLDENGVKGFEMNTWFGFVGPARLPSSIVGRLNKEVHAITSKPDVRQKLEHQGFDVAPPGTPEAFGKIIAADLAKWVPLIKSVGARAD